MDTFLKIWVKDFYFLLVRAWPKLEHHFFLQVAGGVSAAVANPHSQPLRGTHIGLKEDPNCFWKCDMLVNSLQWVHLKGDPIFTLIGLDLPGLRSFPLHLVHPAETSQRLDFKQLYCSLVVFPWKAFSSWNILPISVPMVPHGSPWAPWDPWGPWDTEIQSRNLVSAHCGSARYKPTPSLLNKKT